MSDTPPRAELRQAKLDPATLDQLAQDLTTHAEILEITAKGGAKQKADAQDLTLVKGVTRLQARPILGLQIRYRSDAHHWCDTRIAGPQGIRLVRIEMP